MVRDVCSRQSWQEKLRQPSMGRSPGVQWVQPFLARDRTGVLHHSWSQPGQDWRDGGGAGSTHLGWSRVGGAGRAGCRAGGEGGDLHQDGEVTSRANIVTKGTSRLKDSSLLSLNTLQYFRIDCYHQLVNHSTLLTCSSRWMPRIRTIRPCRAAQAQ